MIVREAIEPRSRAFGVRAHLLKEQPVSHIQHRIEYAALRDPIDTIAGRTPERVLHAPPLLCLVLGR